ncbi:MAG: aldose 1-epimerase family protein [Edaphobacter sp.]|uniref:aldose 1-epimerase family protein n=1 Tax=Edaphobacter sp. TaxID=1934404 RepID=UPI0023885EC9|nr:aldose 1-epimerase family protein [Edaphobacter sp.]MDE1177475.1 aldose 1-epimerase family protein [Edaphobacter sp.]
MSDAGKDDLLRRVGRLSQVGGVSSFTHAEGRAKGTATLRVRTEAGLEFWVVPDRGMDLYEASFRGQSLCWHAPQGMVHPAYSSNRGLEWLKTFAGGLLTTCGLTAAGAPSTDEGEALGLHGAISTTPAEQVGWSETWDGEDCRFVVKGLLREASVHGPNLRMERTISTSLRSSSLEIEDIVTNDGVRTTPLMLIYHFNFGYPLLTERSQMYAPSSIAHPIDDLSRKSVKTWAGFEAPVQGQPERVYFHEMRPDEQGWVSVVLVQDRERPDFGIRLSYDAASLPEFVQWKMTGENHFVLGLEPANCRTLGRKAERERGTLRMLGPGETERFRLRLDVLETAEAVQRAISQSSQ